MFSLQKHIARFIALKRVCVCARVVCMLEPISTPSSCANYVDSGGFSFAPAHVIKTRKVSQFVRIIRHHQSTTEHIANKTNLGICFRSKNHIARFIALVCARAMLEPISTPSCVCVKHACIPNALFHHPPTPPDT
jgi:hypothetical protein